MKESCDKCHYNQGDHCSASYCIKVRLRKHFKGIESLEGKHLDPLIIKEIERRGFIVETEDTEHTMKKVMKITPKNEEGLTQWILKN